MFRLKLTIYFLLLCTFTVRAQGVGLVMSGGGATGFAHIGVIQALEENNIPIDYITGTSAGALIGAMYASGYSPEEIKTYVLSDEFQLMAKGDIESDFEFLLRKDRPNASDISFSFRLDSLLKNSLPTNLVRPELLDFEMMRIFGATSAFSNNEFDSLFVPFRCVASDIVKKQPHVFSKGKLNEAVRASMTFPFYINPIRIDGVLYFDGGLYNNFPSDVMYKEFPVEFIIGSNVSYNAPPPKEDDLIGQVTNMLMSYSNFTLPCEHGIVIFPKMDVSTFDFKDVRIAIETGYNTAISLMDSIKKIVHQRISPEELAIKRAAFKKKIKPFIVSEVHTVNQKGRDESYVRNSILKNKKNKQIDFTKFKRRYFRTYQTNQIDYIFPTLTLKPDSTFAVHLAVRESKPFRIDIGGILSTRAVNTGFAQLTYKRLDKIANSYQVGGYFGKFYNSGRANIGLAFPSYFPVTADIYGVLNRWDYFKSFSTFFATEKPSFLVQKEGYIGAGFRFPVLNNSKIACDYRFFETEDRYFQTDNFSNKDTADVTRLRGNSINIEFEHNSQNRKQYASKGTKGSLKFIFSDAFEHSMPGSVKVSDYDYRKYHQWFNVRGEIQSFFVSTKLFSFGLHGLASITNLSLLKNYTSTILNMNSFTPLPDMQTFFFTEYRSPQYAGAGANIVFTIRKNIELRFDGYWYQPLIQVIKNDDGTFGYSKPFKGESQVLSASAIYHSPLGPLRLSLNYFPKQNTPLSIQFTYGFLIFNDRAFR